MVPVSRQIFFCIIFVAAELVGGTAVLSVDHPVITEIFNDPAGLDGPTGRDPANLHQEFIEIYLPTLADLNPSLHKDALRLTMYEIEGDSGNAERGFVNQRFDLPTFDLDPSNGLTVNAVARPSSGVIVLGWVDYNATVLDLAGTPSTRLGLIKGGITASPTGTIFVAMNGGQFSGTTNFPIPTAESKIDVPNEHADGVLANGSNVYLLVNRDGLGYAQLEDRGHSELGPADASLPSGSVLGLGALLDGLAGNDDTKFSITAQPYISPTGLNIDLEDVLPSGGVFSSWVAQIPELSGGGYARRYVDSMKTTEDATANNESPSLDAQSHYRQVYQSGPFFPTPGSVVFSTEPPRLAVAQPTRHGFNVIAGTTGRPGLISANIGGDFPISVAATPGASSLPSVATFAASFADPTVGGQSDAFPQIEVTVPGGASDGASASSAVTFNATNVNGGDPLVVDPVQGSTATVTVLKPTRGLDALALPFETTTFLAVQGFGADPAIPNEFRSTSLAAFVSANLGQSVRQSLGHIVFLLQPGTNLEDSTFMSGQRLSFPSTEAAYINRPGPPGKLDLVGTVSNSAEVLSGSTAYINSFNAAHTAIKAIEILIPETRTKGGAFAATEYLFFAEPTGDVYNRRSGLSWVTTSRTFELALLDTNATTTGLESGDSDDFGLIVQVGRVRAGATVVSGQFVFLSFSGGLQGEDIDTLDLPGPQAGGAILLDLDNLSDVLGCETITRLFVIDGDGNGTLDVVEALSLHADQPSGPICGNGICYAPENPCNCPMDCGAPIAFEPVCNDGLDDDCDQLIDCADSDCAGTFSCAGPDCGNASCDPPETTCSCPVDCAPPGSPPAPQPGPGPIDKARFISFAPGNAGQCTALRVTLNTLHHVSPPYTNGASVPFTAFEGQVRWVGPPTSYVESVSSATPFFGASLLCTPHYRDWITIGLLHVTGSAIVPSSTYSVAALGSICQGTESTCAAVSGSLSLRTTRWGDVVEPFNPPGPSTQPDVGDISAIVNKFKSAVGAPIKARALLAGNVVDIAPDVGFTHIGACVDAFKGVPYPYAIQSCP